MRLLDAWRLSLGTLTAVPTKPPGTVDRHRAGLAMAMAPLAAAPLGVALAAVALLGHRLHLPLLVIALLGIGAVVLGNRGFHLDGLSDTVDGMAASYDPQRSLQVMKSGTSGPAGTVAVVLVLGLQAAGLASVLGLERWDRAALLAGACVCLSRAALAVCCLHGVPSARPGGLGDTYTQTVPRAVAVGVWLLGAAVVTVLAHWCGLAWWRGCLAAAFALAAATVVTARAVRRFGGVTGDVFGAAIELALAALLVALS